VSPAYLARIAGGEVVNLEPDKTVAVRWFDVAALPVELTQTARNAIRAYLDEAILRTEVSDTSDTSISSASEHA
jgi:hypothetical protein